MHQMREQGGEPGSISEATQGAPCHIGMARGQCGREIYRPLSSYRDPRPVCLMHSADPDKDPTKFQKQLEEVLSNAGEGLADFTGYVFPSSDVFPSPDYSGRCFVAKCYFPWATFTKDANFQKAKFKRGANFSSATFRGAANFPRAEFLQDTAFSSATFKGKTDFAYAEFGQNTTFETAIFEQDVIFRESIFKRIADFRNAVFHSAAEFLVARFRKDAGTNEHEPGPVFSGATFEKPEKAIFYKTHLEQALFHNCDVSKVNFSDVTWRKRATWRRRSEGKNLVFDEVVGPSYCKTRVPEEASGSGEFAPCEDMADPPNYQLERDFLASELAPVSDSEDPCDYRLIEELYQKLKRNYDDQSDYRVAGDFHYGELEVRRKRNKHKSKGLDWLRCNFGVLACYKCASAYGESYVRPGGLLLLVLLAFTLLYPLSGLHLDPSRVNASGSSFGCKDIKELTYWSPNKCGQDNRSEWRARLDLLLSSGLTSVEVAAFQRNITYEPSYRLGLFLVLVETLLTSTLIALFLLAVRRQFKR
jgi:uncharacterized protein YjbI with pentapeptide repeats